MIIPKSCTVIFIVTLMAFLILGYSEAKATIGPIGPQPMSGQQITTLIKLADEGDVDAQVQLALMYKAGFTEVLCAAIPFNAKKEIQRCRKDYPSNYKEALKYFKMAAEAGDAVAQTHMGWFYDKGEGVKQDYNAALKWYRMAAAQDYPAAEDLLARMYRDGHGVPPNYSLAAELFKKATLQLYMNASTHLERLYISNAPGWSPDYETAYFWRELGILHAPADGHPGDDFCCEDEDYKHRNLEEHLTLQQREKINEQVRGYKLPPSKGWESMIYRFRVGGQSGNPK